MPTEFKRRSSDSMMHKFKTVGVVVGIIATCSTLVGMFYLIPYRVNALEGQFKDEKTNHIHEQDKLASAIDNLTVKLHQLDMTLTVQNGKLDLVNEKVRSIQKAMNVKE